MEWFLRPTSPEESTRFENWFFLYRTLREAAERLKVKLGPVPPYFEERARDESFRLENALRFENPRLIYEAYEAALTALLSEIEAARGSWSEGKALGSALERIREEYSALPEAARLKPPFRTFFHLLPAFRGSALGQIPLFIYHPLRLTDDTLVLAVPSAFPEYFEAALDGFLLPLRHPVKMLRTTAAHGLQLEVRA